jgi:predicted DCC family thiol-disulfide oxidoreductase YuxK
VWLALVAQLALLLAVPALLAVREFAVRGGGTPYPWDPPRRLVVTGPYAYVANPMQMSTVALLLLVAALAHSAVLVLVAAAAVAFSVAVAGPHERHDLASRYGVDWYSYRRNVRDWWPRWTPFQSGAPDVVWLDVHCAACAAAMAFLRRRRPFRLTLAAAGEHHPPLWRSRYRCADGYTEQGVSAVARALEHVNLCWAYLGWLLRLPVIDWLAQIVTDALIAAPHLGRPSVPTREEDDG